MFHYKKIENRRELGFAKAWCDKVLTKLSLGHDSKSNTTNINGEIAYNSMKIDASHSRSSKKDDKKSKIKQSRNKLTLKGKKFLLKARDNRDSKKTRDGTVINDQDSHIDFNDSRLGLNTDIVIKKSTYDDGNHNAINNIDIRTTVKAKKIGINATGNLKKNSSQHKNRHNQTVKIEKNHSKVNITAKRINLNTKITARSEQQDKIDEDGKILIQSKKTVIDNNTDIATTHVTTRLERQHVNDGNALKRIRNTKMKIQDSRLNVHANVAVNQTYHSNSAKNDDYMKTQQIRTTATAKDIGITGSINIRKEERCKSDDKENVTYKDKANHVDIETNLPENRGQIKVSYDKHKRLTLDENNNISATHSQNAQTIQFTNSDHEVALGHQRIVTKRNRSTLIQDKIAGRLHTQNNIDISTNLQLKQTHKKSDYHSVHNQKFRGMADFKGDKKARGLLNAERHTANQLDPTTGALSSQEKISAGIAVNNSHTLYLTANSVHHDKEDVIVTSRYGTAGYSNSITSANAEIKQITVQDKKSNQKTQGIWAKFCALGYRLFFSGSSRRKIDYSGQPTNKQRQNVSITLSDDKKGNYFNIALSCVRKKLQGEFKIGIMLCNVLKKINKAYILKFSWKKTNKVTQQKSRLLKPINDHSSAINPEVDLSASCQTTMTTTPHSSKSITNYKGNFNFFGYSCKMEYLKADQHNKNSVDISQQSMNDATMTTSALA